MRRLQHDAGRDPEGPCEQLGVGQVAAEDHQAPDAGAEAGADDQGKGRGPRFLRPSARALEWWRCWGGDIQRRCRQRNAEDGATKESHIGILPELPRGLKERGWGRGWTGTGGDNSRRSQGEDNADDGAAESCDNASAHMGPSRTSMCGSLRDELLERYKLCTGRESRRIS